MWKNRAFTLAQSLVVIAITIAIAVPAGAETVVTIDRYPGIQSVSVTAADDPVWGRTYSYSAIRIDLSTPGLSFRVSPKAGSQETMTQTTKAFANGFGNSAKVAINTSYFSYNSFLQLFGQPYATNLDAVSVSAGAHVSPFDSSFPNGLDISSANVATIVTGAAGGYSNNQGISLYNTIGFHDQNLLVTNGVVNSALASNNQNDKYPGIGLYTQSGKQYLLLLASSDIYWNEMASGFQYLSNNATSLNAMFLDGGGSTSFYLRDPNTNSLGALVDSSRLVGSSLAVLYTAPVPEPTAACLFLGGMIALGRRRRRA